MITDQPVDPALRGAALHLHHGDDHRPRVSAASLEPVEDDPDHPLLGEGHAPSHEVEVVLLRGAEDTVGQVQAHRDKFW